jgi:hypothetical protein
MRKWIFRISLVLGAVVLGGGFATYFGGRAAAESYLAKERRIGEGTFHFVNPKVKWSLDLSADSALYQSPSLQVFAGRTKISADLFRSLMDFSPTVSLHTDTLGLRILPTPEKPKRDSLIFPNLNIPAQIRVRVKRLNLFDSVGVMGSADGILFETRSAKAVALSINALGVRPLRKMRLSLQAKVDWSPSATVKGTLSIHHRG